jgi:hypothetical protein
VKTWRPYLPFSRRISSPLRLCAQLRLAAHPGPRPRNRFSTFLNPTGRTADHLRLSPGAFREHLFRQLPQELAANPVDSVQLSGHGVGLNSQKPPAGTKEVETENVLFQLDQMVARLVKAIWREKRSTSETISSAGSRELLPPGSSRRAQIH